LSELGTCALPQEDEAAISAQHLPAALRLATRSSRAPTKMLASPTYRHARALIAGGLDASPSGAREARPCPGSSVSPGMVMTTLVLSERSTPLLLTFEEAIEEQCTVSWRSNEVEPVTCSRRRGAAGGDKQGRVSPFCKLGVLASRSALRPRQDVSPSPPALFTLCR